MTSDVLKAAQDNSPPLQRVDDWLAANSLATDRCRNLMDDLRAKGSIDYTMLSVALREIRGLRQLAPPQPLPSDIDTTEATQGNGEDAAVVKQPDSDSPGAQPHH